MKIVLVVHQFPPEHTGGTEHYTNSLGRSFIEKGHQVDIFVPGPLSHGPEQRIVDQDGMRLWQSPSLAEPGTENPAAEFWHSFRNHAAERAFQHMIETVQPDIVHIQHLQNVSARMIRLATGRPRLLTLHDYWYFCANGQMIRPDRSPCPGPRHGWNCVDCAADKAELPSLRRLRPLVAVPFGLRNLYLKNLANEIDLFLAPSEFLRQQYINNGYPEKRIQILVNGLDTKRIAEVSHVDSCVVKRSDWPETVDLHLGFIGSIAWQKGVHVLIAAFEQLPPNVAVTIYGDMSVFPEYAQQVRQMSHHPHVRFVGTVPYDQVGMALRQMDALVVPSIWYENAPLVIQEAYGVGVPVIASRLGALTEKVQDGVTGLLFEAGDGEDLSRAIRSLMGDPTLLQRLATNITPGPTMKEHVAELLDIYQSFANAF